MTPKQKDIYQSLLFYLIIILGAILILTSCKSRKISKSKTKEKTELKVDSKSAKVESEIKEVKKITNLEEVTESNELWDFIIEGEVEIKPNGTIKTTPESKTKLRKEKTESKKKDLVINESDSISTDTNERLEVKKDSTGVKKEKPVIKKSKPSLTPYIGFGIIICGLMISLLVYFRK